MTGSLNQGVTDSWTAAIGSVWFTTESFGAMCELIQQVHWKEPACPQIGHHSSSKMNNSKSFNKETVIKKAVK